MPVTAGDAAAIVAVGLFAGGINAVVGSGSLVTFPTLLALGYPAVLANVSNTVGLVPGAVSAAVGYRRELRGQWRRVAVLTPPCVVGGLVGAILLIYVAPGAFRHVVPGLILFACALVVLQPRLARRFAAARGRPHGGPALVAGIGLTSVYGGYFGAAQSIVYLALLGVFVRDTLQRLNAVKNVLAAIVNGVAMLFFVSTTHIAWPAAGLLAAGSVVGGQLGARLGRRLPDLLLRAVIVAIGLAASVRLLM
jgi:uncharacterized membrane protein YfcA